MIYNQLGSTGLRIPQVIFGTSCLGNLYHALSEERKRQILSECFKLMPRPVVLDTAGKYGAGLALEVIGRNLREMGIPANDVLISNKIGWLRTPLCTPEPMFEPGVWKGLKFDAKQNIGYDGILECWEQGNDLLGREYKPAMLSVHDPDEYLAAAENEHQRQKWFRDIIDAYRALSELKQQGHARAIGVGAKDWKVIRDISRHTELDWVMLAVSFTVYTHPPELIDFMDELTGRGIGIINSAVFHAGFLTGGEYFDYRKPDPNDPQDKPLFEWREKFFSICKEYGAAPADVCVRFGLSHPGVLAVALNTGRPERIKNNIDSVLKEIPAGLWDRLKEAGLIANNFNTTTMN
ncbi:aldo/keto reductase [candidate division KSB1 bacterium]|nr:aldo/keto reductase [candidate division KSB1 bacterium]